MTKKKQTPLELKKSSLKKWIKIETEFRNFVHKPSGECGYCKLYKKYDPAVGENRIQCKECELYKAKACSNWPGETKIFWKILRAFERAEDLITEMRMIIENDVDNDRYK